MERGMTSSMVYTSFEKRFRILPSGVVSKKAIGERRMFLSMPSWSSLEANMPAMARAKEPNRIKMACAPPKAP